MAANALTSAVEESLIGFLRFVSSTPSVNMAELLNTYSQTTEGDFDETEQSVAGTVDVATADNVEDTLASRCVDLKYSIYTACRRAINEIRVDLVNNVRDAIKFEIKMELLTELGADTVPQASNDARPAPATTLAQGLALSDTFDTTQPMKPGSLADYMSAPTPWVDSAGGWQSQQPIKLNASMSGANNDALLSNPLFQRINRGFERKSQGLSYYDNDALINARKDRVIPKNVDCTDDDRAEDTTHKFDLEKLKSINFDDPAESDDVFDKLMLEKFGY